MVHKIIVKNAVQRKEGFLYSIDQEGNLIESPGTGVFNVKEIHGPFNSTLRNKSLTRKKVCASFPEKNSTLRNSNLEKNSTLRNSNLVTNSTLRRTSKQQKQILSLCKEEIKLKILIKHAQQNSTLTMQSIYRSVSNLIEKNLIKKYKKSEYGWGPAYLIAVGGN